MNIPHDKNNCLIYGCVLVCVWGGLSSSAFLLLFSVPLYFPHVHVAIGALFLLFKIY